jgi:chromosome segregation ATPase
VGVQGWLLHDLRGQLTDVSTRLEEAHSSLSLVWESTKRLDEDRMARLGLLADSIRSVFDYAKGEVRLWEASYANLGQRVDKNDNAIVKMASAMRTTNTRLDVFGRADLSQRTRLDALERQSFTNSSAVEALSRRTISQEANAHDVSSMVASLRDMLRRLDSDNRSVQQRLASSTSAYGQLGRRVESLNGWAEGFRRAGLSGDAVQGQLSGLADEVRRLRIRVDSLRPFARTVMSESRGEDGRRSQGNYRGNDRR